MFYKTQTFGEGVSERYSLDNGDSANMIMEQIRSSTIHQCKYLTTRKNIPEFSTPILVCKFTKIGMSDITILSLVI